MEPEELAVRNATYRLFVELGRAPTSDEVASAMASPGQLSCAAPGPSDVRSCWSRLHEAHALVLNATGEELRMLNPFSAVPTAHRVRASGRWWYANCAWDAFGVCAALDADGHVSTSCPDCGEEISLAISGGRPVDDGPLFHCLVPATRWWEDIGFT